MTGTDVITNRARKVLQDTDQAAYRYETDVLIRYMLDGIRIITEDLPESLLATPSTLTALTESTTITDTLPIGDRFRDGLTDYVVSRALGMDGMDKRDLARSKNFLVTFVTKTGVNPRRAAG